MTEEKNQEKVPFILITQEWIDRWLPVLKAAELKVYLKLAYHYNHQNSVSFPGQNLIRRAIGINTKKPVINALKQLEKLGLIEILKKSPQKKKKGWPSNKYRMLHVDSNGYHRAQSQQNTPQRGYAHRPRANRNSRAPPLLQVQADRGHQHPAVDE